MRPQTLIEGDRVLVENLGLRGKHKLKSRWNQLPYVVVNKYQDLPVYTVKPESGMGRTRVIHRDHLLPIGQTVMISQEKDPPPSINRPMTRHQRGTRYDDDYNMHYSVSQSLRDVEENSETENEFEPCFHGKEHHGTLEKQVPETNETSEEEEHVEIHTADVILPDNTADMYDDVEYFQDGGKTGVQERSSEPLQLERDGSVSDVEEQIEMNIPRRSQGKVKPVLKLTYDELGKTTDHPLTELPSNMCIRPHGA